MVTHSTHNTAESAGDTTGPSHRGQAGGVLAALPCRPRRRFGTCFWTETPTPWCPSGPFSFPCFVFTLLSAHNNWVEPGTLLTPGLHSQCPALELLGLRVLCEWKVPAVLTITCKPVETIHFQTYPTNVWIFFKNCMQCQQTECHILLQCWATIPIQKVKPHKYYICMHREE